MLFQSNPAAIVAVAVAVTAVVVAVVTAAMAAVEEAVAAAVAAAERGHLRSPSGGYRFFIEALSNMGLARY